MEMRNHGLVAYLPCYLPGSEADDSEYTTMITNLLYLSVIWNISATSSDLLSVFEDLGERTRYITI